ncbi:MAG TPA: hypothetical protein ENI33_01935, partial [Thermoplasmatales archaeon]|nr:hypothetical protein [Thermoplasmatales archaeon]
NLKAFQPNEKYSLVRYMSGTSMATPMVAGAVAHFWCQYPNLGHIDVKNWTLRKVDPRQTLQNRVVSGIYNDGRLRMISGFDFGDAPDPYLGLPGFYPTVLWHELSHGASHEDIGEEWLGWDVSPEYDANVITSPPYDVDVSSNLLPSRVPSTPHPPYQQAPTPDLDAYDDGVSLPLIVFPGWIYPIEFHIQTENPFINDADHGRYDEFQVNKRDKKKIYINTYFDWNHDGDWDDGGEHLVKCPTKQCTWWGGPNMTCCYGVFWPQWFGPFANLLNENAWRRTTFSVPWNALPGITWVRTRLDYGENAGRSPYPRYESHHPFIAVGEVLQDTYAHAQYGEVEDYWLYIINKVKEIGEPKYEETVLLDILQEDFMYGVPPIGWMDTHDVWLTSYTNYAGGISPEAMLPWAYAEEGCMLLTYPINTVGSNELTLQFNTFVDDYGGSDYPYTLHLYTSTDGVSWQEVWNISPTEDYGPSLKEIVLTSENGVGSPTLYIAFTFTGDHYGLNYWYIDDIVISGDAIITYVTSLTPFEIIDYPLDSPYPVLNWYRLWYEGTWSDWVEYGDTFYLGGEGMHQIEYYGKAVENDRIIFYDGFENDMRWVSVDLDNMGYTWQWTNITPYWINETIEGYFMLLDDSICWEICNLDQLSSAPISCSMFNNTMLYFDGIFKTTGNEKLWVNVTNDYWETWTNVLFLDENSSGPWLINISEIADGNEIVVKFTYSDNCSIGYGALIKYVMLYGDVITYAPLHHQFHYVDDTPPTSTINAIMPYTQTTIPFAITYNASDTGCGLKEVELYFRYSHDNSTWSDWLPYAKSNNGKWIFHAPYAPAYYEFYSVAVDNLGNTEAYDGIEATAYVPLQTFAFELKEGWNLITLPCENSYNASSLYGDINGCSIVLKWNASIQDFELYVPGSPYDFAIEDGHGYFIGMKYDTYFALIYDPIESVSIPLLIGWNMLGWFKSTPTNASSLLNSIQGCTIVLRWNASIQDFELYAPGVPNDFIVTIGDGFLVAVDEESIWHGEG